MKQHRILATARLSFPLASALAALFAHLAAPTAQATTYYWDTDSTTNGFGNTAGTWGTNAYWTVTADGSTPHSAVTTTLVGDAVNFGTASAALGAAASAVGVGTVTATSITFGSGQTTAVVLSGGTITLGAASTINVGNATDTINSILAGATTSLTKSGTGILILKQSIAFLH